MLTVREKAVEIMKHLVTCDSHGYSQSNRDGNGEYETFSLTDGTEVTLQRGDRDCSSGVINAWDKARPGCTLGARTTYNIKYEFEKSGLWEWHDVGDGCMPVSGDVMLQLEHVGMYLEPNQIMEFSIPDGHPEAGDQTGNESHIEPFYWPEWSYLGFLHYIGEPYASIRVTAMQRLLNEHLGAYGQVGVTTTGFYDAETQRGLVRLVQSALNEYHSSVLNLVVDGSYGPMSFDGVNLRPVGRQEFDNGYFMYFGHVAWAAKAMLVGCYGADLDLESDVFDTAAAGVLNAFKYQNGLNDNGICDGLTIAMLVPWASNVTSDWEYTYANSDSVPKVYPVPEEPYDPDEDEGEGGGTVDYPASPETVRAMQEILNGYLAEQAQPGVAVSGLYNPETQRGLARLIRAGLRVYHPTLDVLVDSRYDDYTYELVNIAPVARVEYANGTLMYHGYLAWAAKAALVCTFGSDLDLGDWYFETDAAGALNAFKLENGLLANGICDGRTFALLLPEANSSSLTVQYTHSAGGDMVPPVYPGPEDSEDPDGGDPADPDPDDGGASGSGDAPAPEPGAAIVAMQALLNDWLEAYGLDAIEENGVYAGNAQTQGALVQLLQKSRNGILSAGLTVNGVVDAATSSSMDECPVGAIGATDWAVKAMLVGCGNNGIDLNSAFYDESVRQALMTFQVEAGLPADGLCDGAVLAALAPAASAGAAPGEPDLPEQVEFIEVDGWWDQDTTAALQRHYGTVADGEIWGQWQPNLDANTALRHGWVADAYGSGSAVIRKLQQDLGTAVDGVFGGADITKLQERCGQAQTGVLIGPDPTVMELQRRLNYGQW